MAHLLNYCGLLFLCCNYLWLFIIGCLTMYCNVLYPRIWNMGRKLKSYHPHAIWWKRTYVLFYWLCLFSTSIFFLVRCRGLFPFILKRNMKKKKLTILFSFMLDLTLKNLHLVSSFIKCEQDMITIEKYDRNSLYLMFLKCHHHLHLSIKFRNSCGFAN
jgi:hypothetical protein